jgi:hypothetical protein
MLPWLVTPFLPRFDRAPILGLARRRCEQILTLPDETLVVGTAFPPHANRRGEAHNPFSNAERGDRNAPMRHSRGQTRQNVS